MATCIPFQSQLSSIMEVLVKAAVTEISKLVDDKCAFLHLEISRKQSEIEMLRRKLVMMENKTAQLQRGFGKMLHFLLWALHWWLRDKSQLRRHDTSAARSYANRCTLITPHARIPTFQVISNLLFALPENYMDRGTEVGANCPQPSADMKVGIEIIICVCQNHKPNTLIAYISGLFIRNFPHIQVSWLNQGCSWVKWAPLGVITT